jgi:hypothetical protein
MPVMEQVLGAEYPRTLSHREELAKWSEAVWKLSET